jgi:hypothetical protein
LTFSPQTLADLEIGVVLVLLGLALVSVPRAYGRVIQVWSEPRDAWSWVVVGSVGAAAAVRWLIAPLHIVTMFIGYQLTDHAIRLVPWSRYGVGSQAIYHALFAVLPHDHRYLLWTNSVLGVVSLPLIATAGARLLGDRRAGAIFAALLALVPLFIKNDNSDANNVPLHLWLFGGLVLWDEYLETGRVSALLPAGALLALAAVSRPEMPLLMPILFGLTTAALAPARARLLAPWVLGVAGAVGLLMLPHALHIQAEMGALQERESLPGFSGAGFVRMLGLLLSPYNTVITPWLYPVALLPLVVYGAIEPVRRRRALLLSVAAVISLAVYSMDLCRANMARVHVLGSLFVTMLAAAGLSRLWERGRRAQIAAVSAVLLSAIPTVIALWAPTNEQVEEEFLRQAVPRLPHDGPFTLLRVDGEDRDRSNPNSYYTHPYFPDYLVTPPTAGGRVSSLRGWMRRPRLDEPVYAYLGMRCFAQFRPDGSPPPRGDNLQPACAELREGFSLEPVLEQTIPNRGDVWLNYYGDAPTLRLGLYRVKAAAGAPRGE